MILLTQSKEDYDKLRLKDKSVSVEIKMVIDDKLKGGQYVEMFTIDDFREMNYSDISDVFLKSTKHIARTFAQVLLHREDCLNGKMKSAPSNEGGK